MKWEDGISVISELNHLRFKDVIVLIANNACDINKMLKVFNARNEKMKPKTKAPETKMIHWTLILDKV